jgi:hypothetical protein
MDDFDPDAYLAATGGAATATAPAPTPAGAATPAAPFDPDKYLEETGGTTDTLGGFAKNLGEDVVSNVKGVYGLGKGLLTEPVKTVKAIPGALLEEGKRLGGAELLKGDLPAAGRKLSRAMYEKPLSTGLDVAGLAGGAEGVAGKLGKLGELGEAGEVGLKAAEAAAPAAEVSGVSAADLRVPPAAAKAPLSGAKTGVFASPLKGYSAPMADSAKLLEHPNFAKWRGSVDAIPGVSESHPAVGVWEGSTEPSLHFQVPSENADLIAAKVGAGLGKPGEAYGAAQDAVAVSNLESATPNGTHYEVRFKSPEALKAWHENATKYGITGQSAVPETNSLHFLDQGDTLKPKIEQLIGDAHKGGDLSGYDERPSEIKFIGAKDYPGIISRGEPGALQAAEAVPAIEGEGARLRPGAEGAVPEPAGGGVSADDFIKSLPPQQQAAVVKGRAQSGGASSEALFSDGQGTYTPERVAAHQAIIKSFEKPEAVAPPGTKPVATLVIGPPASGKTTLIKNIPGKFVEIDNDIMASKLPGFHPVQAGNFHEEAGFIEKAVLQNTMNKRMNLVLSAVGKNTEKFEGIVKELKSRGYDVDMLSLDMSPVDSTRAVMDRHMRGGRFIDPKYTLEDVGSNPATTYDRLKTEVRNYEKYQAKYPPSSKPEYVEGNVRGRAGGQAGEPSPGRGAGSQPPAIPPGGPPAGGAGANAAPVTPGPLPVSEVHLGDAVAKAKEVKDYITRGSNQILAKQGMPAEVADYVKGKSQMMALQQMGFTPGQGRNLGKTALEVHNAERAIGQYGLDSGIVGPTNGLRGMVVKNDALMKSVGKTIGDYRKLADGAGPAYGDGELLQLVKAKLDPIYQRGVTPENPTPRGLRGPDNASYQRAMQELKDAEPTHEGAAHVATKMNKEATLATKMTQNPGPYTDVANAISEINNERLKAKLTPEAAAKYEKALREFGVNKKIQNALKYKTSGEVKRFGPGSFISNMTQKALDEVGYRVGAKGLNRLSEAVLKNPEAARTLPSLFKEFINAVEEEAKEVTGLSEGGVVKPKMADYIRSRR